MAGGLKGPKGSALGAGQGLGGGPSSPPSPSQILRFGESPLWASISFSGQPVKGVVFPFKDHMATSAKEIFAVSWEIYTEDKSDLLHLMWDGVLEWDFGETVLPIGPLSMFSGSFFDMFFSQGTPSDLEQLAQVKAENEWREMCQSFLIGKTHFFRGLARYQQHPIMLPAGTKWKVHLRFDDGDFQPKGETKMRVILNGRWKTPIIGEMR